MKIAFALIAHDNAPIVERLVRNLVEQGHLVALHYDLGAPAASHARLVRAFENHPAVRFAPRFRVAWGEWSVVQATLSCLETIDAAAWEPDYVYLLSGADHPIRSSAQLVEFLIRNKGDEFIESVPSETVKWVKSGPQRERYIYRWYFNWRKHPRLCEFTFGLQRRLRLRRRFVRGMVPHMGSQWWVLTWPTLKRILVEARQPDIVAFFRHTLVPDEIFFQTLVRTFLPDEKIIGCSLTFHQFSDYGYPVIYYADHLDYLLRQRFFMARKFSPHDMTLRDKLDAYWRGERQVADFDDEDVGLRTPEYNDWRLAHREGVPRQPIVGGAGRPWAERQRSTTRPYFVVLGTSTAELRLVHRRLSPHANLLLHGQLFHSTGIEFAEGAAHFVGYDADATVLRDFSPMGFLTDVMRGDRERYSGFLLRWGQGGPITEAVAKRADVRVVTLRGDPLIAFSEDVLGAPPKLGQAFDMAALARIPPVVAAHRFREFLKDYQRHLSVLGKLLPDAGAVKPKGWVARLNFVNQCRDWGKRLETCFGFPFEQNGTADVVSAELASFEQRRTAVTAMLIAGGIDPAALEILDREFDNPALALALV